MDNKFGFALPTLEPKFLDFLVGYKTALQWSTTGTDQDNQNVESLEDFEFSDECEEKITEICLAFFRANLDDLHEYASLYNSGTGHSSWECAGHDLFLTSAGHGVGFWDRGLGELGDRLTEASKIKGIRDPQPYIGDDGLIYL